MANHALEWVIRMVDRMSPAARAGGESLSKLAKDLDNAKKAAGATDSILGSLSKSVLKSAKAAGGGGSESIAKHMKGEADALERERDRLLKSVLGNEGGGLLGKLFSGEGGSALGLSAAIGAAVALKEVFAGILEVVSAMTEKIGHMVFEITKFAVETAAFKERTMIGLSTVLGSNGAARNVMGGALALTGALPVGARESIDSMKRFAIAGITDPGTLQRLMVMTSDVKAFSGEEGASGFQRQMIDMATVGMQARHLMYLSQQTGIREDLVFKHIREFGHLSGSDEQIKKLIEQGGVSKNVGFNAVALALAEQQHGPIGTLSKKLADSFDGLIERLRNRFFLLFSDFDNSSGFKSIKSVLRNLVGIFDVDSGIGARIKTALGSAISGLLTAVFGDLSGRAGREQMRKLLGELPGEIRKFGAMLEGVVGAVKGYIEGFADAIGPSLRGLLDDLGGENDAENIKKLFTEFGEIAGWMASWAVDLIRDLAGPAKELLAVQRWANGVDAWVSDPIHNRFPSAAHLFDGSSSGNRARASHHQVVQHNTVTIEGNASQDDVDRALRHLNRHTISALRALAASSTGAN